MPKRTDIRKILIIGSGPIVIGQACEFDYSGTQACKALKSLGYEIVLVNSNPATIMTDPETADVTYIEPLNVERLTQIIETERPDALLPNLGGQSGLNLCAALQKQGVLERYGVEVIDMAEDRDLFRGMMEKLHIPMSESGMATTVAEAMEIAARIGYPVMVRPSYVLGGRGMEIVYDDEDMKAYMEAATGVTPDRPILIDRFLQHALECEADAIDVITAAIGGYLSPVPELKRTYAPFYGVKQAVFPFNMFQEVDPVLGPEMRSTGEVLGLAETAGEAYLKSREAAGESLPREGAVLISVNNLDKPEIPQIANAFKKCGYKLYATEKTCDLLRAAGIEAEKVSNLHDDNTDIIDLMEQGAINILINTPTGKQGHHDGSRLRKAAIRLGIPYLSTMAAARAAAEGLSYVRRNGTGALKALQTWNAFAHTE